MNFLVKPQGQRSLRPSFSCSSLSPPTIRRPRLTLVSDGKPLRRLLIVSLKGLFVLVFVCVHRYLLGWLNLARGGGFEPPDFQPAVYRHRLRRPKREHLAYFKESGCLSGYCPRPQSFCRRRGSLAPSEALPFRDFWEVILMTPIETGCPPGNRTPLPGLLDRSIATMLAGRIGRVFGIRTRFS